MVHGTLYYGRVCTYGYGEYFETADICRGRKVKMALVCEYMYPQAFDEGNPIEVQPYSGYVEGGWTDYLNEENNYILPHEPMEYEYGTSCLLIWHPEHNYNTNCGHC